MSGKAARILLSEKQHEILQIIVKSTTVHANGDARHLNACRRR